MAISHFAAQESLPVASTLDPFRVGRVCVLADQVSRTRVSDCEERKHKAKSAAFPNSRLFNGFYQRLPLQQVFDAIRSSSGSA
jgi:hypothetical protein